MSQGPAAGKPRHRTLYYGDCLEWMSKWDSETVDLIYLDPPFNSNASYNILYTDRGAGRAQYRAFDDTWHWDAAAEMRRAACEGAFARKARRAVLGLFEMLGPSGMMAYLTYMAERLEHLARLLKPTGSVYLHCNQVAVHYLKVLMDAVFGSRNFINEIIWNYGTSSGGRASGSKPVKTHDTLLVYAGRYGKHVYNRQFTPYSDKYVDGDVWSDIMQLYGQRGWYSARNDEDLGYPTQKPISLLTRIIEASTNPGDMVLDPFCGCGTAVDAANRLGRKWAGIDISSFAIDLICARRMSDMDIATEGIPYDLQSARKLARDDPFSFESWAVTRMPGFMPNTRKSGDAGMDGRATLATEPKDRQSRLAVAQVKGGKFQLGHLRDFIHVINREKAALGVYVTLLPVTSRAAKAEAAGAGTVTVGAERYPRCQLWHIGDHFEDLRPHLPTMTDYYTGRPLVQRELFA